MVLSSVAAANSSVTNTITSNKSRSLQDGGSSVGLTQGEIIFVTLACFVVVIAFIFAIYSVYKKRRARQQNNHITTPTMSPVIAKGNGMDQYPTADVADNINNRGYSTDEERNRRASIESVDSKGGKRSRRSSAGSAGSNVSNQYKVAAINHMRRMSEMSEP